MTMKVVVNANILGAIDQVHNLITVQQENELRFQLRHWPCQHRLLLTH